MDSLVWIGGAALCAVALAGCLTDLRQRRLPNWLCGLAWISGLGFLTVAGGSSLMLMGLAHSVLALLVGMAIYAAGMIGAGDAKYYAGLAAWFPLSDGLRMLVMVSLAGFFLAGGWIIVSRLIARKRAVARRQGDFAKIPYGVAMAAGAVGTFLYVQP